MLSKAQIKHIQSLAKKKDRDQHQQFVIEGRKTVEEAIRSNWEVLQLFCTSSLANELELPSYTQIIEDYEYEKISLQKTPSGILAVLKAKQAPELILDHKRGIVLDKLQDPGNLGGIIRLADWYGLDFILCSNHSVDVFNPKVLQASMGSFLRIPVYYEDLNSILEGRTFYAADMDGKDYRTVSPLKEGLLVIGNEANGLSDAMLDKAKEVIRIPKQGGAESLNAAMACGIICAQLFDQS